MQLRQAHDDSVSAVNLKKLHAGGVTIATGTDAGNIGTQHAGSYFAELKAMQAAGLSTWDLLVASTLNGAKTMGIQDSAGSIKKGKVASMVLLNANPVDDLANWRKTNRVINRGAVLQQVSLNRTPEMLAQQQLNAYNAHDIDAFLAPYADSIEVYEFPNKLSYKGKTAMRNNYEKALKTPGLYCRLVNRIVNGNMVIDHEEIHATGLKKPFYGIAIYVVEDGKIAKVYFP